jgi:hypothetical protein
MKEPLLTRVIGRDTYVLRLIVWALAILCCPFSAVAQVDFPGLDVFLKSIVKGEDKVILEASGDLNGDGLKDWAGVINRQKSKLSRTDQLYVLLRRREGGYRLAEKSAEEDIGGMGCCWVENLKIDRSSIYLQTNAKSVSTMEATTHQFRLYKGAWRLIGIRIYYIDLSSDTDTETHMNLLTGSVIEKKKKGKNKPRISSRRKEFAIHLLKDFDFLNEFGIR